MAIVMIDSPYLAKSSIHIPHSAYDSISILNNAFTSNPSLPHHDRISASTETTSRFAYSINLYVYGTVPLTICITEYMLRILHVKKIPFTSYDLASDEAAKKLWKRKAPVGKCPFILSPTTLLSESRMQNRQAAIAWFINRRHVPRCASFVFPYLLCLTCNFEIQAFEALWVTYHVSCSHLTQCPLGYDLVKKL